MLFSRTLISNLRIFQVLSRALNFKDGIQAFSSISQGRYDALEQRATINVYCVQLQADDRQDRRR